jgi:hypothetical protein
MIRRFDINHAAKRASFSTDGSMIISCSDFDIAVTLIDAETGSFIASEVFDDLEESRTKAAYVISANGAFVLVYITEPCLADNLAVYNTELQAYHKVKRSSRAAMCGMSGGGDRAQTLALGSLRWQELPTALLTPSG